MAIMTAQEIITSLLSNESVDPNELSKRIEPAQRKYIKPALGKDLYNDVVANPGAANNAALIPYIKKSLQHYVLWEALPFMRNKITAQGLMNNDTEFSDQSSKDDYGSVRKIVMSDAELELKEMLDFLSENKSNYPLWTGCAKKNLRNSRSGIIFYDDTTPTLRINES